MNRYDERDTILSRMFLEKDSNNYNKYYELRPEMKEIDDKLREMPDLLSSGTPTYDQIKSPMANSAFRFLADIKKYSEGLNNKEKIKLKPAEITSFIKEYAYYYSADLVGITEIDEGYYYSYSGREPYYSKKINDIYSFAIVFAVELNKEMISMAPQVEEEIEVTKGYVKAGLIGMLLSYYIRELGYKARNHMDGNYQLNIPPVAEKAGLGEVGRSGMLITKKYGPRVRLGVVTTDLKLIADKKKPTSVREICCNCKKCALNCPAEAIPSGEPTEIIGDVKLWKVDQEKCFTEWKKKGTDCGICVSVCPFS
jgi:NAD-dependent dihydropyrimidine dehydrogenase PreA subunit